MKQILVVDDDPDARGTIGRVLTNAHYDVQLLSSGQQALQFLENNQPEIVILDIMMPEMSGIEVCQRIRANPFYGKLPIIFLSARSRPHEIVEGLDAGGDDYITKPLEIIELPARIRALLRRVPGSELDPDLTFLIVGDLKLHITQAVLYINEEQYELTAVEHHLLHYLMSKSGQPHSIEELLEFVWDYPKGVGDPALVYTHIKNLRRKIEPQPDSPIYIRNLRSRGYIISS